MIVERLAALATVDPGRPAVTGAAGADLTRHDVWDHARRARTMLAAGDPRRQVVAVVDDSPASLAGLLGALDSGRRLLVVAADVGLPGPVTGPSDADVDVVMFAPVWPQPPHAPAAPPAAGEAVPRQNPAALLAGARRLAAMLRIGHRDRIVSTVPVSQLYGLTGGLAAALAGSALSLLSPRSPDAIAAALAEATVVLGTPATYRTVDEVVQRTRRATPLRLALYGGEPDPAGLVIADGPVPSQTGGPAGAGVEGRLVLRELVGRVAVVGGARVALPRVERTLRECPGVRDAAVVDGGRPDAPRSLRGFVVTDAHVSGHDVVQFCRDRGLAAHEVPWIIEEVERIPRTDAGDVDLRALAGVSP